MSVEIGKLCVRRCTQIEATPQRVWEEFASFDKLKAWFGIGHKLESYEPGADGSISLSVELDGQVRPYGGKLVVWEPGSELSIANNWYDEDMAWPVSLFISFKMSAYNGGTLVELFHHGFEQLGADAGAQHEGYEEGWNNQHLKALKKIVEAN